MCELFSFMVGRKGKIYALMGNDRLNVLINGGNPDSHSQIASEYSLQEDLTWKFEIPVRFLGYSIKKYSINELFREIKYDGGLPEEDIPSSILSSIKYWLEENKDSIEEAIDNTLNKPKIELIKILTNKKEGSYFVNLDVAMTPEELYALIMNLRGHWRLIKYKNEYKIFVDMEREPPRPKIYLNIPENKLKFINLLFIGIYNERVLIGTEVKKEKRIIINTLTEGIT